MEVKPYPEVTFDPDSHRGSLIIGRALVELDSHLPLTGGSVSDTPTLVWNPVLTDQETGD